MNRKLQILMQILCITLATVNAFWWGSSKEIEEDDTVKRIPVHLIRTLTYHPVLIPNAPIAPVAPFQYARGFLSSFPTSVPSNMAQNLPSHLQQTANVNPYSSNNYHTYTNYQTNPPSFSSTTTQKQTQPPTTTTTIASSTTTEATTTQQDPFPTLSGKFNGKSPLIADRFSQQPFDYTGSQQMHNSASGIQGNMGSLGSFSQLTKGGSQDPYNLQYVTNIAPMNVQFVPCMCPVEVRIAPSDQHSSDNSKTSEEALLDPNINDLDDSME